jgi:poly(glycerol-phosphate) alpha-glucosyltransferase
MRDAKDVLYVGPIFDKEKSLALANANAFVLPSTSEALPMSVLEAWAHRLPVLMTDKCGLPEGFTHNAAISLGHDEEGCKRGITSLFEMNREDLKCVGMNGRRLTEERFSWDNVSMQMRNVYDWIIGGGARPSTVR